MIRSDRPADSSTDHYPTVRESNARSNDALALSYAAAWDGILQQDAVAAFLSELDRVPPGAWVLDLACGPGIYADALSSTGRRVIALDLSLRMAQMATRSCSRVVCADAVSLPFAASVFAGVWCSAGLVHIPGACVPLVLDEIHRTTVRGACVYLSFQTGSGTSTRPDGRIFFYHEPESILDAMAARDIRERRSWESTSTRSTGSSTRVKYWFHVLADRR